MKIERRSARRIYPDRPVQLIFNCGHQIIGSVHNISSKGVAVKYDAALFSCRNNEDVSAKIAVDQQRRLKVEGLCCTPVYDISTLAHDQSLRGANMRLCGMKFRGLNQTQYNGLHRVLASII